MAGLVTKQQLALLAASMAEIEQYARSHPENVGAMCQSIGQSGKGTTQELLNRIRIWKEQH